MYPILHGISNCDTVRRARAWLDARPAPYRFHDFRKDGVPEALAQWCDRPGWAALLNTRGTTWRQLDDAVRTGVCDAASARAVMQAHPAVVRRPVVVWGDGAVTVGFDAEDWARRLA